MIPDALRVLIANALIELQTKTLFPPDFLWGVCDFFGDMAEPVASLSIAHRRRLTLAFRTLEFTVPIWREHYPDDNSMQRFMERIEALINHRCSIDDVDRLVDAFDGWEQAFRLKENGQEATKADQLAYGIYNFTKAFSALATGERVNNASANQLTLMIIEGCSFAYTGHPYAKGATFNPQRWLEFWTHWITSIVPHTWEIVS